MSQAVLLREAVCLLGRFPALAGVDLDVTSREIVAVRGPNGAGKSTLLRLCAGLAPVTSGTAQVLGVDLAADPRPVRARVGLVGHAAGLFDDLTVTENVAFWAAAARRDTDSDVHAALAACGVDGRLASVPAVRLSAGQRRRTQLATLVARRPELWLLDEPHAGLDEAGRDLVDGLVRQAVSEGATVLVASHDHDRVDDLATRTVEVRGGVVHQRREPDDRPTRLPDRLAGGRHRS